MHNDGYKMMPKDKKAKTLIMKKNSDVFEAYVAEGGIDNNIK